MENFPNDIDSTHKKDITDKDDNITRVIFFIYV